MRYALSTSPQRTNWDWLIEVWQRADQHPVFESGWTFDHFYPIFGDSTEDCLEGWISLTALLQATERIRGGVLVTGMLYRHPAVLANMATTLDITSRGRLELGVGAGWNEEECAAYGIDLGTMASRFDRFEEGMQVLHLLLTQDRSNFSGEHYQLVDAMNKPKPVQQPLPICIGGSGLKRTIPMAAKYAEHWNYGSPTMNLDDYTRRRAVFDEACQAEGRDPATITVSSIIRFDGDLDALRRELAPWENAGLDLAIIGMPKHVAPSAVDDLAQALAG